MVSLAPETIRNLPVYAELFGFDVEAMEEFGDEFTAKMGAEAVQELMMQLDIEQDQFRSLLLDLLDRFLATGGFGHDVSHLL